MGIGIMGDTPPPPPLHINDCSIMIGKFMVKDHLEIVIGRNDHIMVLFLCDCEALR